MGTKTRHTLTTFQGGELSEEVKGRTDIDRYPQGLDVLENMVVETHGSLSRRGGTEYQQFHNDLIVKTIPYAYAGGIINGGISFLLSFSNLLVNGASVLPSLYEEVITPYTVADLKDIRAVQIGDVMLITHPDHPPATLNWDATLVDFVYTSLSDPATFSPRTLASGPFLPENIDDSIIISASATIGTITLTASSALFVPAHVGGTFLLGPQDGFLVEPDWKPSTPYLVGDKVKWNGNVYNKVAPAGTSGDGPPVHTVDRGFDEDTGGGVRAEWLHLHTQVGGVVLIDTYNSPTSVVGVVRTPANGGLAFAIPQTVTTALGGTHFWSEGAWSDVRGWPRAITRLDQRLVYAGTTNNPLTVWGSAIDAFSTFMPGIEDANAFEYTLAEEENSYINWLKVVKSLIIGTTSGLFSMSGTSPGSAVTSTDVQVAKRSHFGAANVAPSVVGENLVFVTTDLRLRQFTFRFDTDSFTSDDITLLNGGILSSGVTEIVTVRDKGTTLWALLEDGTLASCTFDSELGILAWHRHEIGNGIGLAGGAGERTVKSISVMQGLTSDELWFAIDRRASSGFTLRSFTEKLHSTIGVDESVEDSFYFDFGGRYVGAPLTVIVTPGDYQEYTVSIIADGKIHPDKVVAVHPGEGRFTLDYPASNVVYGFKYVSKVRTMPIETGEESIGKSKSLSDLALRVVRTGAGAEIGGDFTNMDPLLIPKGAAPMGSAIPLFDGLLYPSFAGRSTDTKEVQVALRQSEGLPLNISAISVNVRVG